MADRAIKIVFIGTLALISIGFLTEESKRLIYSQSLTKKPEEKALLFLVKLLQDPKNLEGDHTALPEKEASYIFQCFNEDKPYLNGKICLVTEVNS